MSGLSVVRPSPALFWMALFVTGIAWGSTQLLSKLTVNGGHHPLGISFASTLLGAMVITLVLLVRGEKLPVSRRHLIYYFICGLSGTAIPNYFSYAAIDHLPVGVFTILLSIVPMTTFLGAVALGLDRPEPRRFLGLCAGASAVLLLVLPETSLPDRRAIVWVLVALLPPISYTVENIYIARSKPEGTSALHTICGLSWSALIVITPVTLASGTWMDLGAAPESTAAMAVMTVLHLVAYGGLVWLIGQAGPVFAAQVSYVVTLSGVALGMIFLGESHSGWVWLSLVLMLAGLALVQPRQTAR